MIEQIDKVELRFLTVDDYDQLYDTMVAAYTTIDEEPWERHHIQKLIEIFPEGQVVIAINEQLAGVALSLIVDYKQYDDDHTYREITGDYTFSTHTEAGNVLYGIDVFIAPEYRGLRLGRRLYDYRKELCESRNLQAVIFGGRIPHYHKYAEEMSPKEYLERIKMKEIHDPVLNFQLANDFHVRKIIKNYLETDAGSMEYAVLLQWNNVLYTRPRKKAYTPKTVVRLGLVQWRMRPYHSIEELQEQADYFVNSVSGYRCDFVLFPEFFNAPLMAKYNHLTEPAAIRELASYTEELRDWFSNLAIQYNINIITCSLVKRQPL